MKPERLEGYELFARERSLPVFREQYTFIGVPFVRGKADRAAVLTHWEDEKALMELESSSLYSQIVEVHGGQVLANELAAKLGSSSST